MQVRLSILQIVADGAPGGGTTVVLGLCEDLLATEQWNVVLVTQPDSYALQQAQQLGIKTLPFDFFTSRFDRSIPRRLAALIDEVKPDLIHVHGGRAAFPFCSAPLKTLPYPLIYTVHGYHFRLKTGPLKWLGWFAEWQIARRCRFLTWVSQGDKAIAARWHLTPPNRDNTAVIYNGIHPGDFSDITPQPVGWVAAKRKPISHRAKWFDPRWVSLRSTHPTALASDPLPQDKPYDLVFAGRLHTQKNPLFMVDIVACLKERPVSLLMVGGGELESQLQTYAQSQGVDHLMTFTGALSHRESLQALCSARVAVMPSLWEGFPVLPLEAGYLEIPVVAADIPGIDEIIIDGENGYLIPKHDPMLYRAAICRLLDNPELARQMGIRGTQQVEAKFLRNRNTEKFIDLYGSILKKA
ncbi:MAG: hypothetical protein Kow0065_03990 [Methylomicrobium sp.]